MDEIKLYQFAEKLELLGYSKRTIKEYPDKIRRFFKYAQEQECVKVVNNITDAHITAYHTYMQFAHVYKGKPLSTKSIAGHLGAIKTFFTIMYEEGLLPNDLSSSIKLPVTRKSLPRNVPSCDQMQQILEKAAPVNALTIRDRALLEFLYATGIRSEELRTIKLSDYNLHEHTVFIKGKGSYERIVPVGAWVEPYMLSYLEKSRPNLISKQATELLFVSKNGNALSKSNVWKIVKHYAALAGVEKVMPHGFRHACATHLLQNGADIRIVQELLGHHSLASTQVYTRVDIHFLQQAHTKYHPREQWN
jgi:integrase/recombinase XerD